MVWLHAPSFVHQILLPERLGPWNTWMALAVYPSSPLLRTVQRESGGRNLSTLGRQVLVRLRLPLHLPPLPLPPILHLPHRLRTLPVATPLWGPNHMLILTSGMDGLIGTSSFLTWGQEE